MNFASLWAKRFGKFSDSFWSRERDPSESVCNRIKGSEGTPANLRDLHFSVEPSTPGVMPLVLIADPDEGSPIPVKLSMLVKELETQPPIIKAIVAAKIQKTMKEIGVVYTDLRYAAEDRGAIQTINGIVESAPPAVYRTAGEDGLYDYVEKSAAFLQLPVDVLPERSSDGVRIELDSEKKAAINFCWRGISGGSAPVFNADQGFFVLQAVLEQNGVAPIEVGELTIRRDVFSRLEASKNLVCKVTKLQAIIDGMIYASTCEALVKLGLLTPPQMAVTKAQPEKLKYRAVAAGDTSPSYLQWMSSGLFYGLQNGMVVDESIASSRGMDFTLYRETHHSEAQVLRAVSNLRRNRDVVSITVVSEQKETSVGFAWSTPLGLTGLASYESDTKFERCGVNLSLPTRAWGLSRPVIDQQGAQLWALASPDGISGHVSDHASCIGLSVASPEDPLADLDHDASLASAGGQP